MVERYAGAHWGPYGRPVKDDPVNLIGLYVQVVGRALVAKSPRAMLSTFDSSQTSAVAAMQDWLNVEVERSGMAETLQRCVLDAMFMVGICKIGLATPSDAAVKAWSLKAGFPFCSVVDPDDFVYDVHARRFDEAAFMGHRYRVPLDTIKDSRLYSKARKELTPSPDKLHNEQGDERVSVLGRGWITGNDEESQDMIDLWEIYLPRERILLTLADDYLTGVTAAPDEEEALRRQNWLGPDTGPYEILGYGMVPGNAMPKAPIQDLFNLHVSVNKAVRKAQRSIDDMKEVTFVQGQADSDGKRTMSANSGDIIRVDNPDNLKQVVMGGQVIQSAVGMAEQLKKWFNDIGGNLDIIGGRSEQASTAHQEELLNQNAGAGVADLQDATVKFVSNVMRKMTWFYWHHPTAVHQSKYNVAGLPDVSAVRSLHPYNPDAKNHQELVRRKAMMRKGDMPDTMVDPYSLGHATPESRVADLDSFMTQIFIPLAPMLAQQGIVADMHAYLKKRAFYRNMPDLAEILSMQAPPSPDGVSQGRSATGGQGQPPMPGNTTRTNIRKNVSEATPQGQQQSAITSMLSGKSQGGSPNGKPVGAMG